MNADLLDRLSDYRSALDDAITADMSQRAPAGRPPRERGRRALVALAAAAVLVIGVGALVWTTTRSSGTTPADRAPAEQLPTDDVVGSSIEPAPTSTSPPPPTAPSAPATVPVAPPDDSPPTTSGAAVGDGAPAAPIPRLAIGGPVMLGAAPALADRGFAVDAVESRFFSDFLPIVEELRRAGRLGEAVVIDAAGANGPIAEDDMVELFRSLFHVPTVIVLTVTGDRPWVADNNALIRSLPERNFPNVTVVDWAADAAECADECLYEDGIHLRPNGQARYAALIAAAVNEPTARPTGAPILPRTVEIDPPALRPGDWLVPSWQPPGYELEHAQDNDGSRSLAYRDGTGGLIWITVFDGEFDDGLPAVDGWEVSTNQSISDAWLRLDDVRAFVSADALTDADVDDLLASLVPGDDSDVPGDILAIGVLTDAPPVALYEYAGLDWPMRATYANGRYCVEAAGGGGTCGLPIEPGAVLTLAAGGSRSSPGSTTVGITSAGIVDDAVDRVEVELVDGQRISVVPTDLTGSFDHEFWIVVTEVELDEPVPPFDPDDPTVLDITPIVAVTAFDAAGEVLAVERPLGMT